MQRTYSLAGFVCASAMLLAGAPLLRADEIPAEYRAAVQKGLDWVAKSQARDGHWDANGGQYPTTMTALGGMALLMEGSTLREGKYSQNVRRAVDWFLERSQRNGLLGNPNNPTESYRYMYGHGFGMLFLASVYGEEEDNDRRRKLEDLLTRAVQFTGKAQSSYGGWYYTSAADGGDADEGSVTVTQMQGLRAARNAGIVVPKSVVDKGLDYLKKSTTERGGVIYSLGRGGFAGAGGERPALTAAAIACGFSAGEYNSPLAKKWIKYCKDVIHPLNTGGRMGHDEYTNYYYAQAMYILGEDGYLRMFPESKESDRMTWSKYRKSAGEFLLKNQNQDGSWSGTGSWGYIGPIYATAISLTILQLDNGVLPIYQR